MSQILCYQTGSGVPIVLMTDSLLTAECYPRHAGYRSRGIAGD